MADQRIAELERAHRTDPGDLEVLGSLVGHYERIGEEAPYDLKTKLTRLFTELPQNAQGLSEFRHQTSGMIFVMIPAGEFLMGSPENQGDDDERPQHRRVFDEPFLMAKYPWSANEWYRVTGEAPSHFPTSEMIDAGLESAGLVHMTPADVDELYKLGLPDSDDRTWGEHPVESVSWDRCREVEDWINRIDFARTFDAPFRTKKDGPWITWSEAEYGEEEREVKPFPRREDSEIDVAGFGKLEFPEEVEKLYQAWLWNEKGERVGFQLPTEAMWEYATRAGSTTLYPNGDTEEDLEKIAWFGGDWEDGHKAVGLKEPNEWGLHDNCGNVFEWTRCMWRQDYTDAPSNGFLAAGETCPDPTVFIGSHEVASTVARVSATARSLTGHGQEGVTEAGPSDSEQPGDGANRPDPTQPGSPQQSSPSGSISTGQGSDTSCEEGGSGQTQPDLTRDTPSTETDLTTTTTSPSVESGGSVSSDPTSRPSASSAAAAGTALRPAAARPSASGSSRASGSTSWASALPGEEDSPDPTSLLGSGTSQPVEGQAGPAHGISTTSGSGSASSDVSLETLRDTEALGEGDNRPDPTQIGPCSSAQDPSDGLVREGALTEDHSGPAATGDTIPITQTESSGSDSEQPGGSSSDPTQRPCASSAAAAGATLRPSAARPTAAGAGRAAGTTSWASALPGEHGDGSDPTQQVGHSTSPPSISTSLRPDTGGFVPLSSSRALTPSHTPGGQGLTNTQTCPSRTGEQGPAGERGDDPFGVTPARSAPSRRSSTARGSPQPSSNTSPSRNPSPQEPGSDEEALGTSQPEYRGSEPFSTHGRRPTGAEPAEYGEHGDDPLFGMPFEINVTDFKGYVPRSMKANWTIEAAQDLRDLWGTDLAPAVIEEAFKNNVVLRGREWNLPLPQLPRQHSWPNYPTTGNGLRAAWRAA